jgi:DNA-binding winged helix-turn-helix (wHTH) protein
MPNKSKENQRAPGAYRFGEFDLYPSERQLHHRQRSVPLPPKAFDALVLFVANAGRLVRRDELIQVLWPDTFVSDANLTNVIVTLRKVLGREAIQTISKFGYRFSPPVVGEPGIEQATYAMFLQAKELVGVRSLESVARARDLLSLCVANDPTFAAAWAWLGRCARFLDKFKGGSPVDLDLAQAAFRRALAIDSHLACAHHFYTQVQIDLGQSRDAMVRLALRIVERGVEPESFAGLVHALRFCGLLDESVAAHARAVALDPTIVTSVTHTHFLRCEYEATLETYSGTRYYLDAAAWAGLGDTRRAITLLRERLKKDQLSPLMSGLMSSLAAALEGRSDDAVAVMMNLQVTREPEVLFYMARHFSMMSAAPQAVRMLQRAREEGLTASYTLAHDAVFRPLRGRPDFRHELDAARALESEARRALRRTGIADALCVPEA